MNAFDFLAQQQDLRGLVANNPTTLASLFVIWMCVAIWVVGIVQWMIVGDIDPIAGVIGIAVGMGLGWIGTKPPNPSLTPLVLVVIVATMLSVPIYRLVMNRRALGQLDIESIERAYDLLREKPGNLSGMIRLAKALHTIGMADSAIALLQEALLGQSEQVMRDDFLMLRMWKGSHPHADTTKTVRCPGCTNENPPNVAFCQRCGSAHYLTLARAGWTGDIAARRFVFLWAASAAVIAGIPISATSLPPIGSVVAIFLLVGLGLWLIWAAFKAPQESSSA